MAHSLIFGAVLCSKNQTLDRVRRQEFLRNFNKETYYRMGENRENSMPDLLDLQEFDEEALKKESEEVLQMRLMTAENAVFTRTEGGFLSLAFGEKTYDRVGVYLTFPLTNPQEYISIREADEKAKEIGMIRSLNDMPKEVQEMIEEQVRLRYFMPVIRKVMEVKDEYGYAYWHVQTDFGPA